MHETQHCLKERCKGYLSTQRDLWNIYLLEREVFQIREREKESSKRYLLFENAITSLHARRI